MNRIKVLEKQVAELIAAGEVVERPASAAKELIENSIDAGATVIITELKNGGISFLRITDNGSGIVRDDVSTAFLRHATSKISSEDDLDAINSLGFRGEALASIAAVSRLEMFTRTKDELAGTHIQIEGGTVVCQDDAGCPEGTTVIIRELFYNTPARMKFLKKDISEANAVYAVAERLALSHPEISFRFIKDGREELHTPGDNTLISAIHTVLGREFAASLLPVEYDYQGISVNGYVTKPHSARLNRNMQYFYLNGRLVKSKTVMAALEEANKNSVMTGKYPGCVMNITMHSSLVDVNVHPAKTEVRFSNEKQLFDAVYYAVKTTLEALDTRPELAVSGKIEDKSDNKNIYSDLLKQLDLNSENTNEANQTEKIEFSSVLSPVYIGYEPVQNNDIKPEEGERQFVNTSGFEKRMFNNSENSSEQQQINKNTTMPVPIAFKIIGECFNTYIIVEKGDELWLIDKHAAHERILYNELKEKGKGTVQLLLSPISCTLSREEYDAVTGSIELMQEAGFEIEDFGGLTVLVRGAPMALNNRNTEGAIQEIAEGLIKTKRTTLPEKIDFLYNSVACRAAIKAGDKTSLQELDSLARRVMQNNDILYCPHGRPVAFKLTRKEIEKQFGR